MEWIAGGSAGGFAGIVQGTGGADVGAEWVVSVSWKLDAGSLKLDTGYWKLDTGLTREAAPGECEAYPKGTGTLSSV
jgi:hypothetical protein